MNIFATALRRMRAWVGAENSAQLAPTALRDAPAKPGTRERAILHAIRILHDNAYGVTIQEELERAKMNLSFTAINECLAWLEGKNLVEWRMGAAPGLAANGRQAWKKLYSLTEKGTEALRG